MSNLKVLLREWWVFLSPPVNLLSSLAAQGAIYISNVSDQAMFPIKTCIESPYWISVHISACPQGFKWFPFEFTPWFHLFSCTTQIRTWRVSFLTLRDCSLPVTPFLRYPMVSMAPVFMRYAAVWRNDYKVLKRLWTKQFSDQLKSMANCYFCQFTFQNGPLKF